MDGVEGVLAFEVFCACTYQSRLPTTKLRPLSHAEPGLIDRPMTRVAINDVGGSSSLPTPTIWVSEVFLELVTITDHGAISALVDSDLFWVWTTKES